VKPTQYALRIGRTAPKYCKDLCHEERYVVTQLTTLDPDTITTMLATVNPRYVPMATKLNAFTPEECARIIDIGQKLDRTQGAVAQLRQGTVPGDQEIKTDLRDAEIATFALSEETAWIFKRLQLYINAANDQYWRFDIDHWEPGQFLMYGEGGHYAWHSDLGTFGVESHRKISISLQLSPPTDYSGGRLELMCGHEAVAASNQIGSLVMFPSFMTHRIKPLNSGSRRSLVMWILGDFGLK